jgi:hypothetical protein
MYTESKKSRIAGHFLLLRIPMPAHVKTKYAAVTRNRKEIHLPFEKGSLSNTFSERKITVPPKKKSEMPNIFRKMFI